MRDVIVIGAGGGGPVVAKELAARGLDILILEAGPRFADPEKEWTHFELDANGGFFRFGENALPRALLFFFGSIVPRESSAHAFACTCRTMAASHEA